MSLKSRHELLAVTAPRYQASTNKQKRRILDEFVAATGYHRKYAISLLKHYQANKAESYPPTKRSRSKRGRRLIYTDEVKQALVIAWEATCRICSKRLVPFLPVLVPVLEKHGYLKLSPTVREKLLRVSPATVDRLPPGKWVLVAHGDWATGSRTPNATEPGVYMPLTRRDIEVYQPARVLLGHIHKQMDAQPVHYVGSPCGLDISETGRRRCLVYDTDADRVQAVMLSTPVLYFNESFVIVPVEDECGHLRAQIALRQKEWALTPDERSRVQLRVKLAGYSADRAALRSVLNEAFADFSFYKDEEPDISDVYISDDFERNYIAEQVRVGAEALAWPNRMDEPGADEILLEALHIIYGR